MFNRIMTLNTKKLIFNFSFLLSILTSLSFFIIIDTYDELNNFYYYKAPLSMILLSVISGLVLRYGFKANITTDIFFLTIFMSLLSLQSLRIIQPLILREEPELYRIFFSKFLYAFKNFSVFTLLGAALFSSGIKKQKIGTWLTLSLIASVVLAYALPMDSGEILPSYLTELISSKAEFRFSLFIEIIILLTYIKAASDNKSNHYLILALAVVLIITGFEILFRTASPSHITAGSILVFTGTLIYCKKNFSSVF